jgi:hypothetical protein
MNQIVRGGDYPTPPEGGTTRMHAANLRVLRAAVGGARVFIYSTPL